MSLDNALAQRVATRTALKSEVQPASQLSAGEQVEAEKMFTLLVAAQVHDHELTGAVLCRTRYEMEHPGKRNKQTRVYAGLLAEQLDCTRQLVESLKAVAGKYVRTPDEQYVRMGPNTRRIELLEEQVMRLAAQLGKLTRRVARDSP